MVTLTACVDAFVDSLIDSGLRHVVFSPGSRSTPLAMAFARRKEIRMLAQLDERSAGFLALGIAKGGRVPAALLCTSGTAAANYLPAIVEARYGRTPLIVLTADRPHEARELGSPQTIDQIKMYGDFVKLFVDLPPSGAADDILPYLRTTAARAIAVSASAPFGPVHINFPFREPLVPENDQHGPRPAADRGAGISVHVPAPAYGVQAFESIAGRLAALRRGLIVCGPQDDPRLADAVIALAGRLGYPVLADPLSQVRHGRHDLRLVVDAYDWMLRSDSFRRAAVPEVVVHAGSIPTSKALAQFMKESARRLIVIDAGDWNDPLLRATDVIRGDPPAVCEAIAAACEPPPAPDPFWIERWTAVGRKTRAILESKIAQRAELFEGRVARELVQLLPSGGRLFVGNSMPVRDLDAFAGAQPKSLRVLANRGANGIDGVVSTACGVATACGDAALLIGDISFFHDLNGLLVNKLEGVNLTIVVVHNDGGGIFSFLPQAKHPAEFERLFGTPHGLGFKAAVEMYGGRFETATGWTQFRAAVRRALGCEGLDVIEVRTDRRENIELHRQLWDEVAAEVDALAAQHAAGGRRAMRDHAAQTHEINGLRVHLLHVPAGDGRRAPARPVVFLHGFAGCAESWLPVWERFPAGLRGECEFYAPDLIGHGRTGAPGTPDRYRMEAVVEDLAALCDRVGAHCIDLVGYSMGGRLALHFAAARPGRVRRLVLESATAGIDDPAERAARVRRDRELADRIEANGIEAFVAHWESLPLFASQDKLPADVLQVQRRQRLASRPEGLANSLRGMGAGAQASLWRELAGIGVETLLIAGGDDAKFCAIAREMHKRLPRSRIAIVPGAGHNVHLESPERFAEAVAGFLSASGE